MSRRAFHAERAATPQEPAPPANDYSVSYEGNISTDAVSNERQQFDAYRAFPHCSSAGLHMSSALKAVIGADIANPNWLKLIREVNDMIKLDITKTSVVIERQLEVTENPMHRFLLQAYSEDH